MMRKIFLIFCILSIAAFGELKTWKNGTADGAWGTAGNWSPSGVPTTTDTVLFHSDSSADACAFGGAKQVTAFRVKGTYSLTDADGFLLRCTNDDSYTASVIDATATVDAPIDITNTTGTNGTITYASLKTGNARVVPIARGNGGNNVIIIGRLNAAYSLCLSFGSNDRDSLVFEDTATWNNGTYGLFGGVQSATKSWIADVRKYMSGQEWDTESYDGGVGKIRLYWNTATMDWRGPVKLGANNVLTPGTSKLIASGAGAATWVLAGKTIYDLTVNKTTDAGSVALNLPRLKANDLVLTDGYTKLNDTVNVRDLLVNSTDTLWATKDINIGRDLTLNSGAKLKFPVGKWYLAGGTVTTAGKPLDSVIINGPTVWVNSDTVTSLILTAGKKLTITAADKITLLSYSIDGSSASALDSIVSGTAGSLATLDLTRNDTVSFAAFKDIQSTSTTNLDSTSISLGGNRGIKSLSFWGAGGVTITPTTGTTAGGTRCTVSVKTGIVGGGATLGGEAVADYTVINSRAAYFDTPTGTVGAQALVLFNSDQDTVTKANAFTYTGGSTAGPIFFFWNRK